jgi:hypothetical protein
MTTRTAQTLTVTVGTATVEITVDYGIDGVLITRYDTITTDRGVVYEASHELVAASNVAPSRWVSGGVVSALATADENFRDLSAASREAEARASSQWRVFRRRIAAANEARDEAIRAEEASNLAERNRERYEEESARDAELRTIGHE